MPNWERNNDSRKKKILDFLNKNPGEHQVKDVASGTIINFRTVQSILRRSVKRNEIIRRKDDKTGNVYYSSIQSPNHQLLNQLLGIEGTPKKFEVHGFIYLLDKDKLENDKEFLLNWSDPESIYQTWNGKNSLRGPEDCSGGEQYIYKYNKKVNVTIQIRYHHIEIHIGNTKDSWDYHQLNNFVSWFDGLFLGECGISFIELPFYIIKPEFNIDGKRLSITGERFCISRVEFNKIIRTYTKNIDGEEYIRKEISATDLSIPAQELLTMMAIEHGGLTPAMVTKQIIQQGENQGKIRELQKSVINLYQKDNENRRIERREKEKYMDMLSKVSEIIETQYKRDIRAQNERDKLKERISKLEMRQVKNDRKYRL